MLKTLSICKNLHNYTVRSFLMLRNKNSNSIKKITRDKIKEKYTKLKKRIFIRKILRDVQT